MRHGTKGNGEKNKYLSQKSQGNQLFNRERKRMDFDQQRLSSEERKEKLFKWRYFIHKGLLAVLCFFKMGICNVKDKSRK